MTNLTIYDSQGQPLDDPATSKNERIANFFFDGVRLAIESMDSVRAYCFFRARESTGARLDQFYAEFEASSVGEIGNLKSAVEKKVTHEHEMVLESSTEDATVFDLINEASRLVPPGDRDTRDLIPKLIRHGERPRFGVGNYRDALALLIDVVGDGRTNKAAIADNAESAELSDYDIIIETGDHTDLVPLGNTGDALVREKRSTMPSEQGGLGDDPLGDADSRHQSSLDMRSDDDFTSKDKMISIGLISAFGIGILVLIVGIGLFSACFLGVSADFPVVGNPCGSDSGGAGNQTDNNQATRTPSSTDTQSGIQGSTSTESGSNQGSTSTESGSNQGSTSTESGSNQVIRPSNI